MRSEFTASTWTSMSGWRRPTAQTTTGKTKKLKDSSPARPSPPPRRPVDENCWQGEPPMTSRTAPIGT
eukprot:14160572-Alexandrium_andersonii.AAC.1